MDTLTHGFVPYAAFTLARRPRVERIAAAIGGIAPDLDGLWAWLSHSHEHAYPLVHRGFSHTFWGAPLLATFLLFVLAHPKLSARFRRFENIWFTRGAFAPLWIGAWSHLLLDGLTITGVPLLWPLADGRFTTDWFFFGIPYLLPLSLFGWIMVWRGRATDRLVKRTLLVMVVIMLLAGSLRAYSYPRDLVGDEDVTPAPVDWMWYVSQANETGVLVYSTSFGGERGAAEFFPHSNNTESAAARLRCQESVGYLPWNWYVWGLPVVQAERNSTDAWTLTFEDSAIEYNILHPTLRIWRNPAREEALDDGRAFCTVTDAGDVTFTRERGWIGS